MVGEGRDWNKECSSTPVVDEGDELVLVIDQEGGEARWVG